MIMYFTGTKNSQYVANYLADKLDDEVIAIVDFIQQRKFSHHSTKPYIIVAPIYCYRFPIFVENYLKDCHFLGCNEVYCIGTMESQTGKTGLFLKQIFEQKDMDFKGFRGIRMPNNYYLVSHSKPPMEFDINITLEKAEIALKEVIACIINHQMIKKDDFSPFAYTLSKLINPIFVKYQLPFRVNEDCIHCNQCVNHCPTHNIINLNGTITFGKDCIQCLRCINSCPKEAINIKNKTVGVPRYTCPEYKK